MKYLEIRKPVSPLFLGHNIGDIAVVGKALFFCICVQLVYCILLVMIGEEIVRRTIGNEWSS